MQIKNNLNYSTIIKRKTSLRWFQSVLWCGAQQAAVYERVFEALVKRTGKYM